MSERRLLERIVDWESAPPGAIDTRARRTRAEILVRSILRHLGCLLNSRPGCVPIDPEFGVPDLGNPAVALDAHAARHIEDQIRYMVARYEPRLHHPSVRLKPDQGDGLVMCFSLDGHVNAESEDLPVSILTSVHDSGRIVLHSHDV